MSVFKPAVATDWTALLSDPDLSRNLGKLLRAYREAPPEGRDQALLDAMQEIKNAASAPSGGATSAGTSSVGVSSPGKSPSGASPSKSSPDRSAAATISAPGAKPVRPVAASSVPPFEPDLFTPTFGQDRRRHPRMKCFVAVELRVNDGETPVWGNLSNTGLGGCQVETATRIGEGSKVEIGLWVASGKIWVKGLALNGVVSHSTAPGVRVRFAGLDAAGKASLRQFLRYVQDTTRAAKSEASYMQLLK